MSVEQSVECELAGKPKYSEKTCPSVIFSTTNPTKPDSRSNPGRRVGKKTTNLLSYGTALYQLYSVCIDELSLLSIFTETLGNMPAD
jgi:hypothetical protein